MALTLIRHTRVAVAPGLCYGRIDVPLADTFEAEAAQIEAQLARGPRRVFTSPSTRCRRLAEQLTEGVVHVDERLRELDFGVWENRRWDDLPRSEVDGWAARYVEVAPPGGESFHELAERVASFRREYDLKDAVVVTHGGVIRAWLCQIEGRPLSEAFHRQVAHGECIRIMDTDAGQKPPVVDGVVATAHAGARRPARRKTCPRCGANFTCGPSEGKERCWCDELPPTNLSAAPGNQCLCPECLRAVVATTTSGSPARPAT